MATPPRTERFGLALSQPKRDGLRTLADMEGLAEADVIRRLLRLAINDLPAEAKQAIGWQILGARPSNDSGNYAAQPGPGARRAAGSSSASHRA